MLFRLPKLRSRHKLSDSESTRIGASLPLVWLAAAFASGAAAGASTYLPPIIAAAIGLAAVVLLAAARIEGRPAGLAAIIAFTFAGIAAGGSSAVAATDPDRIRNIYDRGEIVSGSEVVLNGVVSSVIEPDPDGENARLRVTSIVYRDNERPASGTVQLSLRHANAEGETRLRYGSPVSALCRLQREDKYLDPGVIPTRESLDRRGVDAACSVNNIGNIEIGGEDHSIMAILSDLRVAAVRELRLRLSPRAAGVMIAALTGDRHFVDGDTAEAFREGGTFHILVVSGLHISFIGGLLLFAARRLTRKRWVQAAVSAVPLWAYTAAAGGNIPAVRAAVMFTLILIGYVLYRPTSMLNMLGAAAIILLAWRPADVFDPTFHLSFVSVAAIVGVAIPLIERLRNIGEWYPKPGQPLPPRCTRLMRRACETIWWRPEAWSKELSTQIWSGTIRKEPFFGGKLSGGIQSVAAGLIQALIISTAAQFAMLPLLAIYFNRVVLTGPISNLWVASIFAVEALASVAGLAASAVSEKIGGLFFGLADVSNTAMLWLPATLSSIGATGYRLPAYSGRATLIYVAYLAAFAGLAFQIRRWRPLDVAGNWRANSDLTLIITASLAIFGGVIAIGVGADAKADGRLYVHFIDVGQGDAILLRLPGGGAVLIDGGGTRNYKAEQDGGSPRYDRAGIGEVVTNRTLWALGVDRLEAIAATHSDADHAEGLADVARSFTFDRLLLGRKACSAPEMSPVCAEAKRQEALIEIVERGDTFEIEGVVFEVLHPATGDGPYDNDASLVLRVTYGGRRFLLTGDIERGAEAAIIGSGVEMAADVVKIPHHGSKTSSTDAFVNAVSARYAIVSAGKRSPFGHPADAIVRRWIEAGAEVLSTQQNGMITFSTDGSDLLVTAYASEK
ncbi:MAG: ComEC/Rec2 family competence protein [Acidobacteria bacterium]|nr:ComEC/Rec2 family competence protein [Acidobacteriota bacterium]MCW5948659.1 ComEC/Rec2 family competence protein [Pyrinomonadaceae bacterium]